MLEVLNMHLRIAGVAVSEEFLEVVSAVLGTNVQRADALADAEKIELVEYKPVADRCFLRKWSGLEETEEPEQLDLFAAHAEARRDDAPIHYTRLASRTATVVA